MKTNLSNAELERLSDRYPVCVGTIPELIRQLRALRQLQQEDALVAELSIGFEHVLTLALCNLLENEGVSLDD